MGKIMLFSRGLLSRLKEILLVTHPVQQRLLLDIFEKVILWVNVGLLACTGLALPAGSERRGHALHSVFEMVFLR